MNAISSAEMLRPSSEKPGWTGLAVKFGTGWADLRPGGAYGGPLDALYTVEIDSTAAGSGIGAATFRWKENGGAWAASGVRTGDAPAALSHGVTVKFVSGGGRDFVLGDSWEFAAVKHFGRERLLDFDRGTAWRSAGLDESHFIEADLGAASRVTAAVIGDHNFSPEALIRLQANDVNEWSVPELDLAIGWQPGMLAVFPDETFRYWRLSVADPGNQDGFLSVGQFFIGSHLAPFSAVVTGEVVSELSADRDGAGVRRTREAEILVSDPAEAAALEAFFRDMTYSAEGVSEPFIFCPEPSAGSAVMVRLGRSLSMADTGKGVFRFQLRLMEEVVGRV